MNAPDQNPFLTPRDRVLAERLDALSQQERAEAPDTLAARVAERTFPLLQQASRREALGLRHRGLKLAAALAAGLALIVGTAWMVMHRVRPPASIVPGTLAALEDDIELLLSLQSMGQDSTGEQIDALFADAAAVSEALEADSLDLVLNGDSL